MNWKEQAIEKKRQIRMIIISQWPMTIQRGLLRYNEYLSCSTRQQIQQLYTTPKEKLILQNGYPSRPWVKNNSCILNYQTKMKKSQIKRTVFVYVSGREHTWTSLEYYFKYLQNDYDHLVIGTWIENKCHRARVWKSQYTNSIHLKKSLKYF